MSKRLLSIFLLIVSLFNFTGCNRINNNINMQENQQIIEGNKETYELINSIPAENLIEMRNSNLWLNIKDLDKLGLDGKYYYLPNELIEAISFSHVKINYPLLIFNTNKVYNLEEKTVILILEDIFASLKEEWGKSMGVNGINPYGDSTELEPEFFNFIDNAAISPSKEKVAFSIHLYVASLVSSITGVFNAGENNIDFVEGPFMGQVQEISWSPDEDYFAFISASNNDEYEIYIINSKNLKKAASVSVKELLKEELINVVPQEDVYITAKIFEWLEDQSLSIKIEFLGAEGEVVNSIIRNTGGIENLQKN